MDASLGLATSPPLYGVAGPSSLHVVLDRRLYTVSLLTGRLLRAPVDALPHDAGLPPNASLKVARRLMRQACQSSLTDEAVIIIGLRDG